MRPLSSPGMATVNQILTAFATDLARSCLRFVCADSVVFPPVCAYSTAPVPIGLRSRTARRCRRQRFSTETLSTRGLPRSTAIMLAQRLRSFAPAHTERVGDDDKSRGRKDHSRRRTNMESEHTANHEVKNVFRFTGANYSLMGPTISRLCFKGLAK
jgi:hypothetical protein